MLQCGQAVAVDGLQSFKNKSLRELYMKSDVIFFFFFQRAYHSSLFWLMYNGACVCVCNRERETEGELTSPCYRTTLLSIEALAALSMGYWWKQGRQKL